VRQDEWVEATEDNKLGMIDYAITNDHKNIILNQMPVARLFKHTGKTY